MASDRARLRQPAVFAAGSARPRHGIRINLSIMMFLQFAIWGSWATVIGVYLDNLKFSKEDQLDSVAPCRSADGRPILMIFSQVADRFVASQRLGVFHLLGAVCLYWVSTSPIRASSGRCSLPCPCTPCCTT